MGLKDEDAIVPVGDKPGKIIALGMDKPEDIRILGGKETKTNAVANGGLDTLAEEIAVDIGRVERQHLADDALILIVTGGKPLPAGVDNIDNITLLRLTHDAFDCTREYPRMAAQDGFLLARSYDKLRTLHCFMSWIVFCGFSLLKTALPATRTSAPASKSKGAFCRLTPPSTSMRH